MPKLPTYSVQSLYLLKVLVPCVSEYPDKAASSGNHRNSSVLADPICKVDNVFHSHAQVAAVTQLISLLTENQTMMNQTLVRSKILLGLMVAFCSQALAQDPKAASVAEVRALSEKRTEAFNAGKADAVVAFFHEDCEYVDEFGTHYQGKNEFTKLLGDYFRRFPGLSIANESESIRA
ncbi:MAG TPA: hypothetical protein DCF63_02270, partial [Planctomycetaceae bacterium]|nr:hypothetical protein [Planctomycetaceae bacterium]